MSKTTLSLCLSSVLLGACQPQAGVVAPEVTAAEPTVHEPAVHEPTTPAAVVRYVNGLQYNGAIGVAKNVTGDGTDTSVFEISAPLLPLMQYTYSAQGDNYPKTAADELALALQGTITYETLLSTCSAYYPDITLTGAMGMPLTKAQIDTNYQRTADCAYNKYVTKPYWIPALINDVDLCALKMGADWHLLSESDLAGFSDADYQLFADTLKPSDDAFFGNFYFSINVFVRGSDGRLKLGTLQSGAAGTLVDISDTDLGAKQSWVPQASSKHQPRCIRRMTL